MMRDAWTRPDTRWNSSSRPPAPTAGQVAERAGVGARTVFRHFEDMETLHAEVSARVKREVLPLVEAPLESGSLEDRARGLVRRRAALFERISPFERSGILHLRSSTFLQRERAKTVRRLRSELLHTLPELESAPAELADALDLFTSIESWDRPRSDKRLGRERARVVVEHAVLALIGATFASRGMGP